MNFTWSFSSLKDYINCPRQYNEVKVLRKHVKDPTPQMLYGTDVHEALEKYVGQDIPLPKNYERFKAAVDALKEIPGTKYVEYKMALDKDKGVCEFVDPNRWVRGIVDLLIVGDRRAFIVDYKTGSNKYPDTKQLALMALMTFMHFPDVDRVDAGLLFVAHNALITERYFRKDIDKLWAIFTPHLARLQMSYDTGAWMPNPTPLCGYCPVRSCEHHKER